MKRGIMGMATVGALLLLTGGMAMAQGTGGGSIGSEPTGGGVSGSGSEGQQPVAQEPAAQEPKAMAQEEKKPTPADGFTLHVVAPHKFENGTVHGPYHHYCKPVNPEVIQCLLFESTDPNALLTDVEYFVSKEVARKAVPLKTWNKYYHDHDVEIATGRVQILDLPEDKAKEIAAAAAKTDGIIFHLWPDGAKAPNGTVGHPQSTGHKHRKQ